MLSTFPHLTDAEFEEGCAQLLLRFQQRRNLQEAWLSVETMHRHGSALLTITKHLAGGLAPAGHGTDEVEHDALADDEVGWCFPLIHDKVQLIEVGSSSRCSSAKDDHQLRRHTVSSLPGSRPVLQHRRCSAPVPAHNDHFIRASGPARVQTPDGDRWSHWRHHHYSMDRRPTRSIKTHSPQHHPITSKPVFFIHPCQTAQVMKASAHHQTTAEEYLMIWIGALGKSVGLNIPLALAREH